MKKWTIYHWTDGKNKKAVGTAVVEGEDIRFGIMSEDVSEAIRATQNTLKLVKEHGNKALKDGDLDYEFTTRKIHGKDFPVIQLSMDEAEKMM